MLLFRPSSSHADVAVAKLREENQNVSSLLDKERLQLKVCDAVFCAHRFCLTSARQETQKLMQDVKAKLEDANATAKESGKRVEAVQHEALQKHQRCIALEAELVAVRGTGGAGKRHDVQAEQLRQLKTAAACSGESAHVAVVVC